MNYKYMEHLFNSLLEEKGYINAITAHKEGRVEEALTREGKGEISPEMDSAINDLAWDHEFQGFVNGFKLGFGLALELGRDPE